jgi:hypothetical protein
MTILATDATADIVPTQNSSLAAKLAITLALAALADWLFYGERVGLSLVIFAIAISAASWLTNGATLGRRTALGGIIVAAGLVPAIEEVSPLSLLIVIMALTLGLLLSTNREATGLADRARALRNLFLLGPFRIFREVPQIFSVTAFTRAVAVWLIPVLLTAIFVALFVAANPLIENWVYLLNSRLVVDYVSVGRTLFWILMLALVWPFIHVRWRRKSTPAPEAPEEVEQQGAPIPAGAELLGASTILRSLILFNLLFAVQSTLDAIYLWGHVALPADVTYASYAHRGAYPLIVTALLAAAFVLVAMRPGGPAGKSLVIRLLVYFWVAQNVLLVVSSILRLDFYVQTYFLTYWRIAAFIWMGLVALGLILIVVRIALDRSNRWLVGANLIVLTTVLYTSALVNFDGFIADYNLNHSSEVSGKGVLIDTNYLTTLGPQALPAIDRVIALKARPDDTCLVLRRDRLLERQRQDMSSWRAFGLRSWRLQRRLDAQAKAAG